MDQITEKNSDQIIIYEPAWEEPIKPADRALLVIPDDDWLEDWEMAALKSHLTKAEKARKEGQ